MVSVGQLCLTAHMDHQSAVGALGVYADGRAGYQLPAGWEPAGEKVLETALSQALSALSDPRTVERVRGYYDREGDYAGTTFLDVYPNDPFDVTAADLWAVSTLNVPVIARQGRFLLDAGNAQSQVRRHLRYLDKVTLPVTSLEHGTDGSAATLDRMWDLHDTFRSLLASDDHESNRWVFAAKLCARKRPLLFPVRDELVCRWLGGGEPLRNGDGKPGDFSIDIQAYAYLMTHSQVRDHLSRIRAEATGVRLDGEDLRLLDVVLWRRAKAELS